MYSKSARSTFPYYTCIISQTKLEELVPLSGDFGVLLRIFPISNTELFSCVYVPYDFDEKWRN